MTKKYIKKGVYSEERCKNISKGRIGIKLSEETKNKLREIRKKQIISEETKKRMSETHKKIGSGKRLPLLKGNQCHSWKGGITPLLFQIRRCFQYRQWRSDVFTRDNFICHECEKYGHKINAHHVKSFKDILKENDIKNLDEALNCEELWNINNGITLCENCHKLTNNYGRKMAK